MSSPNPDFTTAIEHCQMAETAIGIVRDNLHRPSITGSERALRYLRNAKRWLSRIDPLFGFTESYGKHLEDALTRCTTDPDSCDIEIFPRQNVIYINGAFDLEKLRKLILTV